MKLHEAIESTFVRLTDSPRFGIHAGQTVMVLNIDRSHPGGTLIQVVCEEGHPIWAKPKDLHKVVDNEGTENG